MTFRRKDVPFQQLRLSAHLSLLPSRSAAWFSTNPKQLDTNMVIRGCSYINANEAPTALRTFCPDGLAPPVEECCQEAAKPGCSPAN